MDNLYRYRTFVFYGHVVHHLQISRMMTHSQTSKLSPTQPLGELQQYVKALYEINPLDLVTW